VAVLSRDKTAAVSRTWEVNHRGKKVSDIYLEKMSLNRECNWLMDDRYADRITIAYTRLCNSVAW